MIYIFEDTCKKLSGLTSLFIVCKADPEIISVIKLGQVFYYHKKSDMYEVPVTRLAELLDTLTYLDDINLILKEEPVDEDEKLELLSQCKFKPFNHQLEAVSYGLSKKHKKWLLLDEMGLGKTLSLILLAQELKARHEVNKVLIICGINTIKTNWLNEITKYSSETGCILGRKVSNRGIISYSSIAERANILKTPIDEFFVITNIESLRDNKIIEAITTGPNKFDMIILDEAHRCKSKQSIQGNNLLKLSAKYQIAATGTLLLNSPIDTYVPLKWLDIDKATLTQFKNQYCNFGGYGGYQIIGYKNLDILKDEIEENSLRRTKDLLDLPPKTIITEYIDMSDEQVKFYNAVKQGVKEEVDKIELKKNNILSLVTRLRQATACPSLLTTQDISSAKIERAVDLTEQIINNNEKVVIMSNFKEPVKILAEKLKEYSPLICTGDSKDSDIEVAIKQFQEDPDKKVIICTWQRMGTGITLTAASYMIHIDTAFTDALFQQTCDRIYRIGQTKPVIIYNLVCPNTIDERVCQLLEFKKSISKFIVDDDMSEEVLENLKQYIQEL